MSSQVAEVSPTMQAAVLRGWNDLRVEEVPTPELGHGEALLRVDACGICGTDIKMVAGAFEGRWPPALPFVLGHEWAGTIIALGPGTDGCGLSAGDRVAAENHAGCGACQMCRAGRYNLCERTGQPGYRLYGHTAQGALAEYAVRPVTVLHRLPDEVSDAAGALVNQGALGVHAVRRSGLEPGTRAAVFGPGLLGLMTALIALAAGAAEVFVVGRGQRLEIAREYGLTTVDYERHDPPARIRELTGGRGVERVYDCTGDAKAVNQALGAVRRGGRVALLGLTGGKTFELAPDALVLDEVDLLGIRSSPNAYPAMIQLIASGAVDVGPLLSHIYPLGDVVEAFAAFRERRSLRPILIPEPAATSS